MNLLALAEKAVGLLTKWIPDGTKAAEYKAQVVITALKGLGWAHAVLAVVFGIATAGYPLVCLTTHEPLQWWVLVFLGGFTWHLLGGSIGDFFKLWERVKKERDGKG